MKKRILSALSVLLCLCMVCVMLPITSLAAETTYDLIVGGVQVTSDNADNIQGTNIKKGTVSYDPATNTLILDNAQISGAYYAIYTEQTSLNISLVGDNTVIGAQGKSSQVVRPIDVRGNLTFTGDGKLTVYPDPAATGSSHLVNAGKSITFDGCTVCAYYTLSWDKGQVFVSGNGTYNLIDTKIAKVYKPNSSGIYKWFMFTNNSDVYEDWEYLENWKWSGLRYKGYVIEPETYAVNINAGAGMSTSGSDSQNIPKNSAMTEVVYTADKDYYFPEDYAVEAQNGISVTRDSYGEIKVSGTPTADVTLTLPDATQKTTKQPTPEAIFTATDDIRGILTNVNYGMMYSLDGGSTWCSMMGDNMSVGVVYADYGIMVKQNASATKLESDVQTITVTKAAAPSDIVGVACETENNNDGRLRNVTAAMEYKKADASDWISGTGSDITGLTNGTYYVRVKASGTVLASDYQTVEVPACPHRHSMDYIRENPATCTQDGNTAYYVCSGCGNWYTDAEGNHEITDHDSVIISHPGHSGGEATCVAKAVCSECGVQYGEVDASNHKHTEVRNAESPTCCEAGYTGDTYCSDCNTKIATGTTISATGNHVDVDGSWESDGTNHYHTCYFGTKFDITAHSGGEATCKDKAICSVCKTAYGEVNASNHKGTTYIKDQKEATCYEEGYTGDTYCSDCNAKLEDGTVIEKSAHNPASVWTTDADYHWKDCQTVGCGNLIDKAEHTGGEATCVAQAVCSVCGVQYGEIDASNHKHTEVRNAKSPTCCEAGYTGDTYCSDCNTKIATGTTISATGNHVDVNGKWESDGTNHWHTCYFGTKFDITAHSGGEATCKDKAICSVCETAYGEVNASNHKGTTYIKDQKEATCYEEGYTGDTYCSDCDVKIEDGTIIEKSAHNPASVWSSDETDHWKECQTVGCGNIVDKAPHTGGEATCVAKAVCSVCGVQYGEVDASNHKHTEVRDAKDATCYEAGYTGDTWCLDCGKKIAEGKIIEMLEHKLVLVKSEEATAAKEGNIEYYYCENCGKYYSDEAGTTEITKEDTVVSKLAPKIINGNNAKIDKSSKEPVSFRSDAAFADFIRVEVDGKELVKDKDYTIKEGSIIATLTPEFAATLTVGEHTLGIVSASGTAVTNFTVTVASVSNIDAGDSAYNNSEKSPQTGDNGNIIFWSFIAVISLAALCTTGLKLKKKKVR